MHLVGFAIDIYYNARSYKSQKKKIIVHRNMVKNLHGANHLEITHMHGKT